MTTWPLCVHSGQLNDANLLVQHVMGCVICTCKGSALTLTFLSNQQKDVCTHSLVHKLQAHVSLPLPTDAACIEAYVHLGGKPSLSPAHACCNDADHSVPAVDYLLHLGLRVLLRDPVMPVRCNLHQGTGITPAGRELPAVSALLQVAPWRSAEQPTSGGGNSWGSQTGRPPAPRPQQQLSQRAPRHLMQQGLMAMPQGCQRPLQPRRP